MADRSPDSVEVALALAKALAAHDIEYALGGAFAFGIWAVPRGTLGVDVNVFVNPDRLDRVAAALNDVGAPIDSSIAARRTGEEGMFEASLGLIRIDVFMPSIPFSWEAARTRRSVSVEGVACDVLSPEALAVFKLLFFRPKDIVDLERLIAVQGSALDVAYVRGQIVQMLGGDDPRVAEWDRLAEHAA